MFSKNAKIDRLKRVPLFSECSRAELATVAGVADEVHFPAGRTLIRQGATGREFIVVLEGKVEVSRSGRRIPIDDDADFFGEAALLTGAKRNATVKTVSPVRALVITDRAFWRLLKDSPRIQGKIIASLASRLANAN